MTEFHAGCNPCQVNNNGQAYVVIDKLFGPLVACKVRVHLDINKDEWVIEREIDSAGQEGQRWQEMCRFDCQESLNLNEDE